jgi:cytochrome b561
MATAIDGGDGRATQRYTRVAIALHWAIAALVLYNLASGLLRPVLPRGFFVFHVSSGITILALTLVRIGWRLTHRPPPMLPMKGWERHLAHLVHVLLYLAMLLLPFSGWALVSARPPAGSPGAAYAEAQREAAGGPGAGQGEPARMGPGRPGSNAPAAPKQKRGGAPMIWGVFPLPMIGAVHEIGRTPEGVAEQRAVHERIETFHLLGGWTMLALFLLHVAGALKHQIGDRLPELARMGAGHGRRRG